ncbi:endolytic transglycosylase MltG [Brevibacillus sp. B_LB10_24]|uniref:endolytic transglycosylase MltG n=1 Tax=Brevibacillus sp. B_LB10_24 TaxID=3380645 RepID=UPI0038B8A00A
MEQNRENRAAEELPVLPKFRRRRRRGGLLQGFLLLLVLLVLAAGAGAFYVYAQLQPIDANGSETVKEVDIPAGSSVRVIGQILQDQGLIKNGLVFSYYSRYKGISSQLQAGKYQFRTGMTLDEILQDMAEGKVVKDSIRFTIPEGWSVEQIAAALEKDGLVKKDAFLKEVNEGDFSAFSFVSAIPAKAERKYRLEGYLFPETYEVEKGATAHDIIVKMLQQFEREVKPEWLEALKKRNITLDNALILASIVEREVTVDKERPLVAGVFFNRLRDNWPLQADATVQFALGKQRDLITYADLKVESPYNTYLHKGLPPGPIASPGRASIEAVVKPASHDYFFYVTKKDGSSEHYFSRTLQEHDARDAQSRSNK